MEPEDAIGGISDCEMKPVDTIAVGPRKTTLTHLPEEKYVFLLCLYSKLTD